MPIGILIITKMHLPDFSAAGDLAANIDAYFKYIKGEFHFEKKPAIETKNEASSAQKVWNREAEPATIAGLAFFLGFNSRQAFYDYEVNGKFSQVLKRGRLRIEAMYEKKLHQQSSTGVIFALKSLGWNENKADKDDAGEGIRTLEIRIIETGPKPANNEKEVVL
jgi:hypothetical protein